MKKILTVFMVALLLLSATACGGNGKSEESTDKKDVGTKTEDEKANDNKKDVDTKTEDEKANDNKKDVDTKTEDEKANDNKDADTSDLAGLSGKELFKAVMKNYKEPQNLYAKIVATSTDLEWDLTMLYYVHGKSHKTSMDLYNAGTYNHTLYLEDDSYVYNYTDGKSEGFKYPQDSGDEEDSFIDLSFGEDDSEDTENIAEAKIEMLDGVKCIYMKYLNEDGSTDETWLSLEHNFPLRIISKTPEGTIETEMNVVEIDTSKDFSSECSVPEDITFSE